VVRTTEELDPPTEPRERFVLEVVSGPDVGARCAVEDGLVVGSAEGVGLRLTDAAVSARHFLLELGPQGATVKDLGSANGLFLSGARTAEFLAFRGATFTAGRSVFRLTGVTVSEAPETVMGVASRSPEYLTMLRGLAAVARSHNTVLLLGETGVGKSSLAKTIHDASPRAGQPFVALDCGTIAHELVESTLFGHVVGAFTGATTDRRGYCREADGGTLLLDEVGELPLSAQVKLLRVLETRLVRPVGADQEEGADFRLIAATHRDLPAMVKAGQFRSDLYYRLERITFRVPALRERREDLFDLIDGHLATIGKDPWDLPVPLRQQLLAHPWPGNLRELFNVLQRTFVLGPTAPATDKSYKEAKEELVDVFARAYFSDLFRRTKGNVTEMARTAGVARTYAHELVKKYDLK
jgi:two-component system, NtrC family, response regulator GlrR